MTRDAISDLCTDTVRHKYPVARPDGQTVRRSHDRTVSRRETLPLRVVTHAVALKMLKFGKNTNDFHQNAENYHYYFLNTFHQTHLGVKSQSSVASPSLSPSHSTKSAGKSKSFDKIWWQVQVQVCHFHKISRQISTFLFDRWSEVILLHTQDYCLRHLKP